MDSVQALPAKSYLDTPEKQALLSKFVQYDRLKKNFMIAASVLGVAAVALMIPSVALDVTVIGSPVGAAMKVAALALCFLACLCITGAYISAFISDQAHNSYWSKPAEPTKTQVL